MQLENQFLISSASMALPQDDPLLEKAFRHQIEWEGLKVLQGEGLKHAKAEGLKSKILVLGVILDPDNAERSAQQILSTIVAKELPLGLGIDQFHGFTGRFVCLISDGKDIVVFNDAMGLKRVFVASSPTTVLSSLPDLILGAMNRGPGFSLNVERVLSSKRFQNGQSQWFGDRWYDEGVRILLPNHYFSFTRKEISRMKRTFDLPSMNEKQVVDYAVENLRGSLRAAHRQFNIWQPVTAGFDSRALLGASKPFAEQTHYYLFSHNKNKLDVEAARKLSLALGIKVHIIQVPLLDDSFVRIYKSRSAYSRILPKTAHIQWHYLNNKGKRVLNINGNGGEIARCFYPQVPLDSKAARKLSLLTLFPSFFEPRLTSWCNESKEWVLDSGLGLSDLFYWEQRCGIWGAAYPAEQDLAIEELSPFSNRNLLLQLLYVSRSARKGPGHVLFKKIIGAGWPKALDVPFNDLSGLGLKPRLKGLIKNNSGLYFFLKSVESRSLFQC